MSGHDGRRGFIYHTTVKKELRGQGIGKKLVDSALAASIKYGEAIESGDHKNANSQSNTIRKIRKQLLMSCELESLIPCMQHENDYVKLNVASSLIQLLPDESKKY